MNSRHDAAPREPKHPQELTPDRMVYILRVIQECMYMDSDAQGDFWSRTKEVPLGELHGQIDSLFQVVGLVPESSDDIS